jgi:hypothetical protein
LCSYWQYDATIDRSGGIHGNKGTEAAIAWLKWLYSPTGFFDTSKKKSKFIAHWSFDRQRIAFRVEGIEQ